MATSNFDLPEEVLVEIMSWVPPKSLIRSKCVNKSWNALISSLINDTDFVNKHLHNIRNYPLSSTRSSLLWFPHPPYCPDLSKYCLDQVSALVLSSDDVANTYVCRYYVFLIPPPSMPCMPGKRICHCNGLICVAAPCGNIVLCNPAIMELRILPKQFFDGRQVFVVAGLGFGYDARANDYKVVKVLFDKRTETWLPIAQLYSMKTDSWSEIGIDLQLDDFRILDTAIFCKGVVYWSLLDSKCRSCGILCFDMSDDIFCCKTLPDNVQTQEEEVSVAAWNESVVLFSYSHGNRALASIKVWVMDDCSNGVNGSCSWVQKLTIGPLLGIAKPLTLWKDDEIFMEGIDEGLISYNLRTQLLKNIALPNADRRSSCRCKYWVFSYVKSLVSVRR